MKLDKTKINSVQIPGYNFEYNTESNNGGTAIYIKKRLNYKLRNDLQIYKPNKELESTFIEITRNKEIVVVGYIYMNLSMELSEFNSDYLASLLEELSLENKTLVLLGYFNADLLKYHKNNAI